MRRTATSSCRSSCGAARMGYRSFRRSAIRPISPHGRRSRFPPIRRFRSTRTSVSRRRWRDSAGVHRDRLARRPRDGNQTNNSRSHFDAQRFMEVGKPADPALITGWLGRHINSVPAAKGRRVAARHRHRERVAEDARGAPQTLPIADPTNFSIAGIVDDGDTAPGLSAERLRRPMRRSARRHWTRRTR